MYTEIMVILPSLKLLHLLLDKERVSVAQGNRLEIRSISPLICCFELNLGQQWSEGVTRSWRTHLLHKHPSHLSLGSGLSRQRALSWAGFQLCKPRMWPGALLKWGWTCFGRVRLPTHTLFHFFWQRWLEHPSAIISGTFYQGPS